MTYKYICLDCGNDVFDEIEYLGNEEYICKKCNSKNIKVQCYERRTPYERMRDYVYSTGNKWAIENWEATHN